MMTLKKWIVDHLKNPQHSRWRASTIGPGHSGSCGARETDLPPFDHDDDDGDDDDEGYDDGYDDGYDGVYDQN